MPRNASKPKRKLKTHRGAAKRFKVTATGKIIRSHSGKRHLLGTKAPGRMRKLKKLTRVSKADTLKTKQLLPYGLR
jgi:large subunit ribosomal protein L35